MAKVPGAVTDLSRVKGEDTHFTRGSEKLECYIARPTTPGSYPGIIVIHEAFGLNDHIRDLCRRFANLGYNALAPSLYSRIGTPDPNDFEKSVVPKMVGLYDSEVVKDLEAAADTLRHLSSATQKVGVIGFCSGGRQTLMVACKSTKVDAAVDCWGGFIHQATPVAVETPMRPVAILDMVEGLNCPLFAVFGAEDTMPSPAHREELEKRVKKFGKKNVTIKAYAGAGHAFLADYRPTYREGPAFEVWPEIVSFFGKWLKS